MVRGDSTANGRRDRGASMVLLIGGLVIMGIMAVVVLKVVQNQNDDTVNTLKDVKSAAGEVTTPPSPASGAAPTTAQNMIGAAQAQECVVEKQTVEQAEDVGSTLESRPLTTDELVSLNYLKDPPAHYEVVVNPDGTTTVRSKAPAVCP